MRISTFDITWSRMLDRLCSSALKARLYSPFFSLIFHTEQFSTKHKLGSRVVHCARCPDYFFPASICNSWFKIRESERDTIPHHPVYPSSITVKLWLISLAVSVRQCQNICSTKGVFVFQRVCRLKSTLIIITARRFTNTFIFTRKPQDPHPTTDTSPPQVQN